jgi:hypothetical protein
VKTNAPALIKRAAPFSAANCCARCRKLQHTAARCCTLPHCWTAPHTAARSAIHTAKRTDAHYRALPPYILTSALICTLSRTLRAHYCAHCHTLPRALPHTDAARAATHCRNVAHCRTATHALPHYCIPPSAHCTLLCRLAATDCRTDAAHCRTATHALPYYCTPPSALPHTAARKARTARTVPCTLPHTVTHTLPHTAECTAARIATQCHTATLPRTAVCTGIHRRAHCHKLPHTAAHGRAHCRTLPHCHIRTAALPHITARTTAQSRAHYHTLPHCRALPHCHTHVTCHTRVRYLPSISLVGRLYLPPCWGLGGSPFEGAAPSIGPLSPPKLGGRLCPPVGAWGSGFEGV